MYVTIISLFNKCINWLKEFFYGKTLYFTIASKPKEAN